ncbi:PA24C phospholipase, partial [Atractosteus spatula]|nr:PA24C phospholipase [Atractosteus spatula]
MLSSPLFLNQACVPPIAMLGSGGGLRAMVALMGTLSELGAQNLLDTIMYLCGVSGSTWCMSSLYRDPQWSSHVKEAETKMVKTLSNKKEINPEISNPENSLEEMLQRIRKAIKDDNFSCTDLWATIFVYMVVKEVSISVLLVCVFVHIGSPPLYRSIRTHTDRRLGAPTGTWFEITRHEAGYPEYGAFVDTSALGSQFHGGNKIKHKDEMDMLCLQGLCGSAIGDMKENKKFLIEGEYLTPLAFLEVSNYRISSKDLIQLSLVRSQTHEGISVRIKPQNNRPSLLFTGRPPSEDVFSFYNDVEEDEEDLSLGDECEKRAMIFCLLKLHWNFLCGKDCKHILNSMKNIVKEANEQLMVTTQATENAASYGNVTMNCDKSDVSLLTIFHEIYKMVFFWIWGTKHNFLYEYPNTDNRLPRNLVTEDKIYLIDAGLSINSAYPLVLRRDRGVQLILSFDFSEGDPFMTVTKAAEYCNKNKISFPPIPAMSEEEKNCPSSVYIFKGTNTPTVMHFPLFNKDNCGGK